MWIADNWTDYEVIDCSKGEKLERWGDYILVRPDPQVHLGYPEETQRVETSGTAHYHRSKKAAANGSFSVCPNSGRFITALLLLI